MEEHPPGHRFHGLTYQLNLNDHTLDDNLPSCSTHFRPPLPRTDAGALDALPPELLQGILSQLDLRSMMDFWQVNTRAMELVSSLAEYKAINTHAPDALRGILRIGTGRWITCRTLYEKLCMAECETCGDFGGYLYLITCKRVCFLCFSESRQYRPVPAGRARLKFGLDAPTIRTLPRMRAVPGSYSPVGETIRALPVLVNWESALHAAISLRGSSRATDRYVAEIVAQSRQAYDAREAAAQQSGSTTHRRRPPRIPDPSDGMSENPLRFVAIVRAPWWDRSRQQAEWGFHCVGCAKSTKTPLHYRRKFTAASFDDHLKLYGSIQDGKHNPVPE